MPLPETSELPTATQVTPANIKIGNRYGVPYVQYLGKKKHGPGNYTNNTIKLCFLLDAIVIQTKVPQLNDVSYVGIMNKYFCV